MQNKNTLYFHDYSARASEATKQSIVLSRVLCVCVSIQKPKYY